MRNTVSSPTQKNVSPCENPCVFTSLNATGFEVKRNFQPSTLQPGRLGWDSGQMPPAFEELRSDSARVRDFFKVTNIIDIHLSIHPKTSARGNVIQLDMAQTSLQAIDSSPTENWEYPVSCSSAATTLSTFTTNPIHQSDLPIFWCSIWSQDHLWLSKKVE